MPYIEEIVIAGRTKEVTKRYSSRYGKRNIQRSKNINPTKEDMRRINERRAEATLRRLINANFNDGDIHLVLTYRKNNRPTPEEAKKKLSDFMKKLRRYYKRNGSELKYITVTEYRNKAIHHHLIINTMDTRDLMKLWPHGIPRPTYLYSKGQYKDLAKYFIKETSENLNKDGVTKKRWNSSRNLVKPKVQKKIIRSNSWRKEPKATKGYIIEKESIKTGYHEVTGHEYQFYSMLKIDDQGG